MNEDQIVSYQCSSCGLVMFPRHTRCRRCRKSTDFREVPVREGTVVTHTRLTATRPGFAKELRLVLVELSNGARVLGQLGDDEEVKSGSRVVVSWGKLSERDGKAVFGFRFLIAGRPQG
jgi:uncharacterized OB-fold protein